MVKPLYRDWTQEQVNKDFSYVDGVLFWATGPSRGKKAGWVDPHEYTLVRYKNKLVRAHNLVWLMFYGKWPDFEIDHSDNNPSNNRIENLRQASRAENCSNQKLQKRRLGKFKGVHENKTSYYVKIKKDGKQHNLGSYQNELEAAMIYNVWAEKMFGRFAHFNKVFEDVDTW
jgi:hypothetical protein